MQSFPVTQPKLITFCTGKRFSFGEDRNRQLVPASGRGDLNSPVYECKTCSRQFSSFQALGGHRASHKKPRLLEEGAGEAKLGVLAKLKGHECSICGLEFAVGQALGGHMGRHRAKRFGRGISREEKIPAERKRVPMLDLNLPPIEEGYRY